MKDLISREALYRTIEDDVWMTESTKAGFKSLVRKAPAVDAVEVVHAKWIRPTKINSITFDVPHCSACHEVPCDTRNYCPFCGARMDGESNE